MKFFISSTFNDSLKEETWDDHKKGWSYPWLKTNWVVIKSMEIGGASIPKSKYKVDNKEGIIFWLSGGQPKNVSIEVESKKSFLGLRRKSILTAIGSAAVLALLYFVAIPKEQPDSEVFSDIADSLRITQAQLDTSEVRLVELNTIKDSLETVIEMLGTSSSTIFLDSIAGLKQQITKVSNEKQAQKTSYRRQLSAARREVTNLEAEIAQLKSTPPPPENKFPGFTAKVMCEPQTSSDYYARIARICTAAEIEATDLKVQSPAGKIGTICYGTHNDAKRAAQFLKDELAKLGLAINLEACSSQGNSKQINIYID